MPISLFSDLVSLLTLHIYSFYIASARIFNWQLTIIISLFHLFRGKKRNVLRDRIDSCDYDLDQLLLGTIMFTLLAFLFPTVMVFYFAFAIARAGVLVGKVILAFGHGTNEDTDAFIWCQALNIVFDSDNLCVEAQRDFPAIGGEVIGYRVLDNLEELFLRVCRSYG